MDSYELKRMLEAIPALVEKLPALMDRELKECVDAGIESVTGRINRTMEAVKVFEEMMAAKGGEVSDHFERLWKQVSEAHTGIRKRIELLPAMPAEIKIPYNFKEVLDLAERCERLSPQAWDRAIAICKACSQGE